LRARDDASGCLYNSITDCGAGGLSSAVGEMGARVGAVVDLEHVPLKYAGLRYDEIWISEAQERMVFSVPPDRLDTLLRVFADEEVEATVIGRFSDDRVLRVRYDGMVVGELDMKFLHDGVPTTCREARWQPPATLVPPGGTSNPIDSDLHRRLLAELATPVIASKEFALRTYDHEVQGGSVVKPLCGPGHGPSDAAVLRPRLDSRRALALGCGLCPERSDVDPYWMAVAAIDEALRNIICVGGDPARTAILDNFCWGRTDSAEAMGTLVRACQGAHDAAVAYGLPFISGKDSLNNEFVQSEAESARTGLPQRITIPGTLLISALSMVEDVSRCITMDLKRPGHSLILVRCSAEAHGLKAAAGLHSQVARWIRDGRIVAAHDVSDGGVAVTVAEMCIAGRVGARIRFDGCPGESIDELFDTWMGAYVLECAEPSVELSLNGGAGATGLVHLGTVEDTGQLEITRGDAEKVTWSVEELGRAWQGSW
ncbi:MAG: phosphoribosylformylglycinamidine synthase subunit PurL, partial [Planctomycetes bacterium]|nr:phosphoribosylformylglycinamidine synthase subunit PurL [Planctomycetota bacterium]